MSSLRQQSHIIDALARLETALSTPAVPGELELWSAEVHKATDEVTERLHAAIANEHPEKLEEISKKDAGLARRAEQMREHDQELEQKFAAFHTRVKSLDEHAENFEPDEQRVAEKVKQLIAEGLDLVVEARKHETEIDTWHVEAFDRERGVGD